MSSFAINIHHKTRVAPRPEKKIEKDTPIGKLTKKSKKSSQQSMICLEPTQGCRDFPPEEMRTRNWLFDVWRSVASEFGFEEYDAPILESEELYIRKGGEEITQQMYNFVTKDGHRVALRPEMTPTLARLVMAKGKALSLPVKWFSIPQCWRHEAISRGRRREHYQWNLDILGVKSVHGEAELLSALCTTFRRMGLTAKDIRIKINSRKILQSVIQNAGVPDALFADVCIVVDKMEKVSSEELVRMLVEIGLSQTVVETILTTLSRQSLADIATILGEEHAAVQELKQLFQALDAYGVTDWIQFDASVVRGLAYYTGIVFEAVDREGKFRAICGGGRYDNLLTTYGAKESVSACGFGFGDCVILELLQDKKMLPDLSRCLDDVVIAFDESMRIAAIEVLNTLRQKGRKADIVMDKKKLSQAFAYADARGADRVILVAPDEWAAGQVQVKYLRIGEGKKENQSSGERGVALPVTEL